MHNEENGLKNLVTAGRVEGKRGRGKQRLVDKSFICDMKAITSAVELIQFKLQRTGRCGGQLSDTRHPKKKNQSHALILLNGFSCCQFDHLLISKFQKLPTSISHFP